MILKALTLENFKGIREPVRIEFAPVTLLFGPNNAGKSTVIQAIHYAREIFERGNCDPGRTLLGGDVLDLGGFESLVHDHDRNRPIRMRFELDLVDVKLPYHNYFISEDWQGFYPYFPGLVIAIKSITTATVQYSVNWSNRLNRPILNNFEISLNGEVFARIIHSEDDELVMISTLNLRHPVLLPHLTIHESPETLMEALFEFEDGNTPDSPGFFLPWDTVIPEDWKNPLPLEDRVQHRWWYSLWNPPPPSDPPVDLSDTREYWEEPDISSMQLVRFLSTLILGPGALLQEALHNFRYLSPFRSMPGRNHQPARSPDEFRWSNGMAAWDLLLLKGEGLASRVNTWLNEEEHLNAGYRIEVKRYKELELDGPLMLSLTGDQILDDEEWIRQEVRNLPERRQLLIRDQRNRELFPQDVGVGISQVVPVLVAALHSQTGIVAIEEPESNIHPGFQVALGDLFISQTQEKTDLMFLMETHSEHLMLRFLRRIRETSENELPPGAPSLTPEGVAVYFVEPQETGPRIHRIRIDTDGDFIDRWPRGFFQERIKEIY